MYSDSFSCNDCGSTERYGRTRTCKSCHKVRCKQYYLKNKDRLKQKANNYYADNKDVALARVQAYRKANPNKVKAAHKKHYDKNAEKRRAYSRDWLKDHKAWGNAYSSYKRAKLRNATPSWLSEEDKKTIIGYYAMSQRLTKCLGIEHHVDHIYPLAGKEASGLHVPWNLRVIPAKLNLSKSNKLPEGIYNE